MVLRALSRARSSPSDPEKDSRLHVNLKPNLRTSGLFVNTHLAHGRPSGGLIRKSLFNPSTKPGSVKALATLTTHLFVIFRPGFPASQRWTRPRMRLSVKKAHEVRQSHQIPQEIRGKPRSPASTQCGRRCRSAKEKARNSPKTVASLCPSWSISSP